MKIKASTYGSLSNSHSYYFHKKVSISYDTNFYDSQAEIKCLVIIEPDEVLKNNWELDKFDLILTWKRDILNTKHNNVALFPFGTTWIRFPNIRKEPSKLISVINSGKTITSNHLIRNKIINNLKKEMSNIVDIYGKAHKQLVNKEEALEDYKFHIVIENSIEENWFTEKLIDAFLTGTIPLYFGAPNIEQFFDINGMYIFSSQKELIDLIKTIAKNPEENFRKKEKHVFNNFNIAMKYSNLYERIQKRVEQEISK